jgi:hypothetical protein
MSDATSFDATKIDPAKYIEQFAATTRRMIAQSGEVAKQAAKPIEQGKFTADEWIKSAIQLMDITVLGVLEITENLLAGPAAPSAPTFAISEPMRFRNGEGEDRHIDIKLARAGTNDYIESERISTVQPEGTDPATYSRHTLPASATHLQFRVDTRNLPGGVYAGTAIVSLMDGGAIVGDPLDVFIAL